MTNKDNGSRLPQIIADRLGKSIKLIEKGYCDRARKELITMRVGLEIGMRNDEGGPWKK